MGTFILPNLTKIPLESCQNRDLRSRGESPATGSRSQALACGQTLSWRRDSLVLGRLISHLHLLLLKAASPIVRLHETSQKVRFKLNGSLKTAKKESCCCAQAVLANTNRWSSSPWEAAPAAQNTPAPLEPTWQWPI